MAAKRKHLCRFNLSIPNLGSELCRIMLGRYKFLKFVPRRSLNSTTGRSNFVKELKSVKEDYIRRSSRDKARDTNESEYTTSEAETIKKEIDESQVQTQLLDLISKSKRSTFSDPANQKLDLSGSNTDIYNKIVEETKHRRKYRIKLADDRWREIYDEVLSKFPSSVVRRKDRNKFVTQGIQAALENATISPETAGDPISIGDIVALSEDSTSFYIVVGVPVRLSSPFYTYINKNGEIIFSTKDRIKLRFPQAIPKVYTMFLKSLVTMETKWKDISPVGYPDAEFTRSDLARPHEVSSQSELESELKEDFDAFEYSTEIAQDSPERDDDNLVMNSASAQLLTNTDVNTYQVTWYARELYCDSLRDLGVRTSNEMSIISKKLEFLHRLLQYNESGDLIDSPTTISIFELLEYLNKLDLEHVSFFLKGEKAVIYDYNKDLNTKFEDEQLNQEDDNLNSIFYIQRHLRDQKEKGGGNGILGKEIPKLGSSLAEYNISTYLAAVLILRQQSRLWNLNQYNPSNPPISVTILPIHYVNNTQFLIEALKTGTLKQSFAEYVVQRKKDAFQSMKEPRYYKETVELLKNYVAGNITSDPEAETAIVSIIRKVEELAKEEGITLSTGPDPSFEYSKVRCYEILQILKDAFEPNTNGWENPISWSYALQLPNKGSSTTSSNQDLYFNYLDEKLTGKEENLYRTTTTTQKTAQSAINDSETLSISSLETKLEDTDDVIFPTDLYESDPLESIRENFGETPIYCIDSETAHEIDDGISIQEVEGEYIVSVHVANPTSYIKPNSSIANIALGRGNTTYLPEGPTMMLPKFVSNLAGLGTDAITRTFVVQYHVPKSFIDSYIAQKAQDSSYADEKILEEINKVMLDSASIKVGTASNFPAGYTYTRVNEILSDESNAKAYNEGKLQNAEHRDLFKLHDIAVVLKDIRVLTGNAISLSGNNSSISVKYGGIDAQKPYFAQDDEKFEISLTNDYKNDDSARIGPIVTIGKNANQSSESRSQLLVSECMVSANTAASYFAKTNKIPIIFRSQNMNLDAQIEEEIRQISRDSHLSRRDLEAEIVSKFLPFLTSARLQTIPVAHQSIGVAGYATVTSPLRRYIDMINHWQFEDFLLKTADNNLNSGEFSPRIDASKLPYISQHLQSCELVNKQSQRFSNNFWVGVFLNEYHKFLSQNRIEPIKFRLLIQSLPRNGLIRVQMLDFGNMRASLSVLASDGDEAETVKYKIGEIVEDYYNFSKLDYLEHEIVLQKK